MLYIGGALPTAVEGEEEPAGACGLSSSHAHDAGPSVGRYPDHGYVVEGGPGPGDPAAIG
jgi:hypothetical protein